MSDTLRIALVAEGPTDYVLVQAALVAILDTDFILTQLQPEATRPYMGQGWSGVLKWCHDAGLRYTGTLSDDPALAGFDMLIIHLDVDVAQMSYQACGAEVVQIAETFGWLPLPCHKPCPPASHSAEALADVMASWLGKAMSWGERTVLCLPAQSTGTWLAAAALGAGHKLLRNAECNVSLENQLGQLPKNQRIKKSRRDYQAHAGQVINNWAVVKDICVQAGAFEDDVRSLLVQEF